MMEQSSKPMTNKVTCHQMEDAPVMRFYISVVLYHEVVMVCIYCHVTSLVN